MLLLSVDTLPICCDSGVIDIGIVIIRVIRVGSKAAALRRRQSIDDLDPSVSNVVSKRIGRKENKTYAKMTTAIAVTRTTRYQSAP